MSTLFELKFDKKQRTTISCKTILSIGKFVSIFKLAIDTGSYYTFIDKEALEKMFGVNIERDKEKKKFTSATGKEFANSIISDYIEIGKIKNVLYPVYLKKFPPGLSVEGILGWSFFDNLGVSFDFKNGIFSVEELLEAYNG